MGEDKSALKVIDNIVEIRTKVKCFIIRETLLTRIHVNQLSCIMGLE